VIIKQSQRGIISLLTAIFVGILLIILTIALVGLMAGNFQQASDDQLSQRAFAAAEGTIELLYGYLQQHPQANFSNCDGAGSINSLAGNGPLSPGIQFLYDFKNPASDSGNKITCVKITQNNNAFTGSLGLDEMQQVRLDRASATGLQRARFMRVSWVRGDGPFTFPDSVAWNPPPTGGPLNPPAGSAPAIELTIVKYPFNGAGQVLPGSIGIRNSLLFPTDNLTANADPKIYANCNQPNYRCVSPLIALNLAPGSPPNGANDADLVLIRPRFLQPNQSVHYQIQFFAANGTTVIPVQSNQAVVDVTARSGGVYRRIIAHVPIGNTNVPSGINYVLYGDTDICKDLAVSVSGSEFNYCP
jgi:hypothetical protein